MADYQSDQSLIAFTQTLLGKRNTGNPRTDIVEIYEFSNQISLSSSLVSLRLAMEMPPIFVHTPAAGLHSFVSLHTCGSSSMHLTLSYTQIFGRDHY